MKVLYVAAKNKDALQYICATYVNSPNPLQNIITTKLIHRNSPSFNAFNAICGCLCGRLSILQVAKHVRFCRGSTEGVFCRSQQRRFLSPACTCTGKVSAIRNVGISVGRKNEPGVYVSEVVKGGAAEADNRLMTGDQVRDR